MKSCPAVDPLTGLVMVGSHDGHVYALSPQVRMSGAWEFSSISAANNTGCCLLEKSFSRCCCSTR